MVNSKNASGFRIKTALLAVILICCCAVPLRGQQQNINGYWQYDTERGVDTMRLAVVNFRINSWLLERDFMNNAATLDMIYKTLSDEAFFEAVDYITITASASPDGNTSSNKKLAENRAQAIKTYIMWRFPHMDRDRIRTYSIGEDWEGLRRMVYGDPKIPHRDKVLKLLDSGAGADTKRQQLKRIGGGEAWQYIVKYIFPPLRGGVACMIFYKGGVAIPAVETRVDTVFVDRVREVERIVEVEKIVEVERKRKPESAAEKECKPYYWAVKTNLLSDVVLLPDLALEFSIGRKWSVELGGQWAWWNTPYNHHNSWRIQTAGVEGRRWLGDRERKTPLSGHYLGLYGMAGTYDVRLGGGTGYLSNMSYSAGISYGYALPIGRSWNIDFGLAVGYFGGKYETYSVYNEREDIFYRDGRFRKHWFGPTKLKISFMWLPGGKNPRKQ